MENLVSTFVVLLTIIAIAELVLFLKVLRELLSTPASNFEDTNWPKAIVILSLRGIDPSLKACITGLFKQDYPHYHIHIIVDNDTDPAWEVIAECTENFNPKNLTVESLKIILQDCSLKCSAITQVLPSISDDTEILVFLDADVIPHQSWLKELVSPLVKTECSVVSGLRWYALKQQNSGNMLRYLWNAASIVQIYWHKIPWGGSLAISRDVIDKTNFLQRIKQSLGEDTVLGSVCHEYGLEVKMIPALIQINEEKTSLIDSLKWIIRQLISSRLYHPRWYWILLSGLFTQSVLLYGIILTITTIFIKGWYLLFLLSITYAGYVLLQLLMVTTAQKTINSIAIQREKVTQTINVALLSRFLIYIPMTQLVYPCLLMYAQFSRTVIWRGVNYLINGAGQVRLLEYLPYRQSVNDKSIL